MFRLWRCRLLRGGVDWNCLADICHALDISRLLRGGVDWNLAMRKKIRKPVRSPPSRRRGLKYWLNSCHFPPWMSPPSRRRGLKFDRIAYEVLKIIVASFAEAWIEIKMSAGVGGNLPSPPSRRRGLKYFLTVLAPRQKSSPPSRRRGLKYGRCGTFRNCTWVASFAEAWIEMKQ